MISNSESIKIYAITAIQSISVALSESNSVKIADGFNWQQFIDFCSKHRITDIVFCGLKKANTVIPDSFNSYLSEHSVSSSIKEAIRDIEINELIDDFEKNKIKHLIMKGFVIKNIYPEPYLRSMGDADILVGEDIKQAEDVLIKHGFTFKGEGFLHNIFYKNKLYIELHKSLIDESIDEYYNYYGVGFDKAQLADGCKYRYIFSNEQYYIFMIVHAAKHFKTYGTGIRTLLDIFIYNRHYSNKLNYQYIYSELKKLNLEEFEKTINELSVKWFSQRFDSSFDSIGEYIISSGVYGSADNHELNAFLISNKNGNKGKFTYIFRCIFPDKEYMCNRYPKCRKYSFLIPFYRIKRIFSTIIHSRRSIRYRLKGVAFSNDKNYEIFNKTGLK